MRRVSVAGERARDDKYMKFKEEIKEKFHIRQKIGNVSDSIIKQFERWWDKYGTALSQIDSELEESDKVSDPRREPQSQGLTAPRRKEPKSKGCAPRKA